MAKRSIADLKSAWKKKATSENQSNSNYYPFYRMDVDKKATIRFLPDLNEENPLGFVYEKTTHTLKVNGKDRTVPCLKMYGKACPICKKSAEFYEKEGKQTVTGKRLYRRKQTIAQALIVEDPLTYTDDQEPATGKVKLLNMSYTLVNIINAAFDDNELDEPPHDFKHGTDFIIKKTQKGEYASYELSKFARNERPLTEAELAAMEGNLVDLSTLIPECPDEDKLLEMLDADLNGTPMSEGAGSGEDADDDIDPQANTSKVDRYGDETPAATTSTPVPENAAAPAKADSDGYQEEADDILTALRKNRAAQQQ